MKKILLVTMMIALVWVAKAQVADTVQTQQQEALSEPRQESGPAIIKSQDQPDTTTKVIQNVPEPNVSETQEPATQGNEPKIIYYQTTPEKKYESSRNYSYRSRSRESGDIKTLAGSMHHSGGFGAISFRTTDFLDETMVLAGVRAGWIINRTVGIGFEGHGIIPTTKYSGIDITQDVFALGGYGGMFIEMIVFSNYVVHLTFPTSAGAGWLGYNQDWENSSVNYDSPIIDEDIFWYVEPGANIEVNISRNFRMDLGISKRFTQDLELLNTNASSFENLNYYVTLKIGGF